MAAKDVEELAAKLDLGDAIRRVCWPCLSFVAFPVGDGDERTARREARKMAPILWDEGLREPALKALRDAKRRGLPGAAEALENVGRVGGRSSIAIAIVLRLAAELDEWSKKSLRAHLN